jgi:hypothetical protein
VKEAEGTASVLIIDSITHFWKELCDSYVIQKSERLSKKQNRTVRARLEFQDWGYLKGEWGKFTDLYVNSALHIILCGRAGFEYDYFENDDGKKELEKTGVKMKAEGEMGFEPSLLVLMERQQKIESGSVESVWREGTVLKDRSTLLDGKVFVDPKFVNFLPHIERLNLGSRQLGVDTTRGTKHNIPDDRRDSGPVQRKIVIGEIQDLLVLHIPGQAAADKQRKVALLKQHFKAGWVEIEEAMSLTDLRAGYDSLHRELEGVASRYGSAIERDKPVDMNDELPEHSAPPAAATTSAPVENLREVILRQLKAITDIKDCLRFALEVSVMQSLSKEDHQIINAALLAHQKVLADKEAEAKPDGDTDPQKPRRKNGAVKQEQAPADVQAAG